MRRTTRSKRFDDPARTLRALAAARAEMVANMARLEPAGPAWHGCAMVQAAIDGLATFITGNPQFFWATGVLPHAHERRALEARAAFLAGEEMPDGDGG